MQRNAVDDDLFSYTTWYYNTHSQQTTLQISDKKLQVNCHYARCYCASLQPWALGVCTLPAVPRSTQPSTLHGTVKEYQLSGLVLTNNKWRWWLLTTAAYRRTHMQSQVAWSEGRRPLGAVLHSSNERSELLQ